MGASASRQKDGGQAGGDGQRFISVKKLLMINMDVQMSAFVAMSHTCTR